MSNGEGAEESERTERRRSKAERRGEDGEEEDEDYHAIVRLDPCCILLLQGKNVQWNKLRWQEINSQYMWESDKVLPLKMLVVEVV